MNNRPNTPSPNVLRSSAAASVAGPSPAELLAKMPRKPLTPEQQLAALDKVQAQATQRIKLGQQLFKAAEARLTQQQDVLDKIRNQQQDLREQVQQDVAKSLQTYDQWMGKIDESFTGAIRDVTARLNELEAQQHSAREEMQAMVARASALMEQTQRLLMDALGQEVEEIELPTVSEAHLAVEPTELEASVMGQYAQDLPEVQDEVADEHTGPLKMTGEVIDLDDEDDVFGQVLKRLRDADAEQDGEEHAAA